MSGPVHLARRFLGSLSPRRLDPADAAWVGEVLSTGEMALWEQMPLADRKHAAGVARAVAVSIDAPGAPVLAAALLHDVGKIEAGFGTVGRVMATLVAMAVGRHTATQWRGDGVRGRIGRYLRHDQIGADLLTEAGAEPLTVTWTREHHLAPERWSLDADVARALAAADDD